MRVTDRQGQPLRVGDEVRFAPYPPIYRIYHITRKFVYAKMTNGRISIVCNARRPSILRPRRCAQLVRQSRQVVG